MKKRRPKALLDAVVLMAESTGDGKVGLGALGQYMKRTNPSFVPKVQGESQALRRARQDRRELICRGKNHAKTSTINTCTRYMAPLRERVLPCIARATRASE